MAVRRKVVVKGIVQGVSYRKHTLRIADTLGIRGWVRNRSDGNVEACFEGDTSSVEAMLTWCFFGPIKACVDEVIIRRTKYRGSFRDFKIKPDRLVA